VKATGGSAGAGGAGGTGKVVRYKVVRRRFPVGKTLCLAPGTTKPAPCPS
jgi:hypothetical protein